MPGHTATARSVAAGHGILLPADKVADMRTAVVRVQVDPAGRLTPEQLTDGMAALRGLAEAADIDVLENNIAAMPAGRREVEMLMAGTDAEKLKRDAVALCANAFGTTPAPGVVTYVSRGTDDDAHGVLAGFGLTGDIARTPGPRRPRHRPRDAAQGRPRPHPGEPHPHGVGSLAELRGAHQDVVTSAASVLSLLRAALIRRPGISGSRARPAPRCRTC